MSRSILFALALAAASARALAQAPPPAAPVAPPGRLSGVITALSDQTVSIKAASGAETTLALTPTWTVVTTRPVDIDAIQPGSFVATANIQQANGDGKSIELRLFEPGNHGGEGSRPMAQPGQIMTNAAVVKVTKGAGGRELDVAYPGGTRHIIVPPEVQVIGTFPADRDLVKPGVTVNANTARGEDGTLRVTRIAIAAAKP